MLPERDEKKRLLRVEAIRNGALVRQHLGQAARYMREKDGRHVVILHGGARYSARTLQWAINKARDAIGM